MIKFNNQIISKKREILWTFSKQLGDRYNAGQNADKGSMHDFVNRNIKNKLNDKQKQTLESRNPYFNVRINYSINGHEKREITRVQWIHSEPFQTFLERFRNLSDSRGAIVTLIPKAGKSSDTIKGWRPIKG